MPRPREYVEADVVQSARRLFWEHGYGPTGITELERGTGLSRSSLYLAFGSKRELLSSALELHNREFIDPLLSGLERKGAGLNDILAYLRDVKQIADEDARRKGCLLVNTIAELAGRDPGTQRRAEAFRERLHGAFGNALAGAFSAGEMAPGSAARRTRMLVASVFGIWALARVDSTEAGRHCDALASEIRSWRVG